MRKLTVFSLTLLTALSFFAAAETRAQNRKSISAAEVNGTFRSFFKGRFKGSSNEIKILALGKGRLKVSFDLIYPYVLSTGELSANLGEGEGEAVIEGDTAVYLSDEFGACKITIKFVKPGTIKVSQEATDADCGFGHNVTADGIYRKVSGAKPKF